MSNAGGSCSKTYTKLSVKIYEQKKQGSAKRLQKIARIVSLTDSLVVLGHSKLTFKLRF